MFKERRKYFENVAKKYQNVKRDQKRTFDVFFDKSLNMTCMFTVFRVNYLYIFTLFYQKGSLNREYKTVARCGRQEKVLSSEVQNYLT